MTLCNLRAHQAPLSMEFSRQEYWGGCHFLLQVIFLTQGSNLSLLHWQVDLYHWATWEAHVCVNIQYLFFSFWLTSLCITGSIMFIHLTRTDSNSFLYGCIILHCIYVPKLFDPLVYQWASRLLSCPGYCK